MTHISTQQQTLAEPVFCNGVGLHSGRTVHLAIMPAPPNHGIKFCRVDLPNRPVISALFQMVVDTSLATVIGDEGIIVSTVEHVMASLTGMGVDNALVEVDAHEIPIMDGSAKPYTDLIQNAGIRQQESPRFCFVVKKPIEISDGVRFAGVYPSDRFKITYTIDFPQPIIGRQHCAMDINARTFAEEICFARTFTFYKDIEFNRQTGLALGGSLDNAIVVNADGDGVMNPDGLRAKDEFVRHKILDCIGDFSLLGMPFLGHMVVEKSGHLYNHAFLTSFFKQKKAWETMPLQKALEAYETGRFSGFSQNNLPTEE